MSTLMDIEFVHALNPLYAFPIVAVILCAFIVYAFGFKSPVQPPSFDAIDEEKKSTKKRKAKENSKVKVIQNGKLNGSTLNKNQVSVSSKKKEMEKAFSADKSFTEKSVTEKKVTKKSKSSNEKKVSREKKKDSFSQEDAGEGGWVQLISKKERKNRKKDEAIERQTCIVKPVQYPLTKSDEFILSEEIPKTDDVIENSDSDKKLALKAEENESAPNVENCMEKIVMEECKTVDISIEKTASDEKVVQNEKILDETTIKSKKKKKKNPEVNTNSNETNPELSAEQKVISEVTTLNSLTNNSSITIEAPVILVGNVEEHHSKETKASNVVFDELAGLYPEQKEQKKKKKVRRDH